MAVQLCYYYQASTMDIEYALTDDLTRPRLEKKKKLSVLVEGSSDSGALQGAAS